MCHRFGYFEENFRVTAKSAKQHCMNKCEIICLIGSSLFVRYAFWQGEIWKTMKVLSGAHTHPKLNKDDITNLEVIKVPRDFQKLQHLWWGNIKACL